MAGAIAARTRRMKIGIAVKVLPLCNPLRTAEELVTTATCRTAWRDAGHPGDGVVYLRAHGYLAATQAAARAEYEASLTHCYRAQDALLWDSARRTGVGGAQRQYSG